jgi:hypothetical protein
MARKNLPAKRESQGIIRGHKRRLASGKVIDVNKGVPGKQRRKLLFGRNKAKIVPKKEKIKKKNFRLPPRIKEKKDNLPEIKTRFKSYTRKMDATDMAIFWYFIDHERTFGKIEYDDILEIAGDLSEIAMLAPISYPPSHYKPGEFKRLWKNIERDMKFISVDSKNQFTIKGSRKIYSPIQLFALFIWAMYRLSYKQLKDQSGYGWIADAEVFF